MVVHEKYLTAARVSSRASRSRHIRSISVLNFPPFNQCASAAFLFLSFANTSTKNYYSSLITFARTCLTHFMTMLILSLNISTVLYLLFNINSQNKMYRYFNTFLPSLSPGWLVNIKHFPPLPNIH